MKKKEEKEKMYCGNRNCQYLDCVRHDKYIPFGVLIRRENYTLDKNGICKEKITEWK